MTSKFSIKLLIAAMLLAWVPQQMTLCLASMSECVSCCCACCLDEGALVDDKQNHADTDCCITLRVDTIDETAPVRPDNGIKHDVILDREYTVHAGVQHPGDFVYAHQRAQAPPGPPLRLTLCRWLI